METAEENKPSIVGFRLALQTLDTFCKVSSPRFKNWLTLVKNLYEGCPRTVGMPAMIKAKPFVFAHCLSRILDLRNGNKQLPNGIHLRDWELAHSYCKKLSCTLGNALQMLRAWSEDGDEKTANLKYAYHFEMKTFFTELRIYGTQCSVTLKKELTCISTTDWKTQLLWSDLQLMAWPLLGIDQPLQIQVPEVLHSLTGSLKGLLAVAENAETMVFTDDDDKMNGWMALIEACKASRSLMKEFFKASCCWFQTARLLTVSTNVAQRELDV